MKCILQGQKVSGLPDGGIAGQILEKTDTGTQWTDKPSGGMSQTEADARYLQLSGGTMAGEITFSKAAGASVNFPENQEIRYDDGDLILGKTGSKIMIGAEQVKLTSETNTATLQSTDFFFSNQTQIKNLRDPTEYDDAATKNYVDSKRPKYASVTLTTSGWSSNTQIVTVSGVSADETAQLIQPMPAVASQSAYYAAGILCTNQAANSLTFTCQEAPSSDLTVYVVIQEVIA